MKPCRDCQHPISGQAFACPSCGAPFPAGTALSDPSQVKYWLALGLLFSAGAGYITFVTVGAYGQMASSLGRSLPSATAYLLRFHPLLVALPPLLVLGVWRFWSKRGERGIAAAVSGAVLFFLLPQLASTLASSLLLP